MRFHLSTALVLASLVFAFTAVASADVIGTVSTSDNTAISVDLTAEGTLDWKMWGEENENDVDEKVGADEISDLGLLSGTSLVPASNDINTIWSDGTPDLNGNTNNSIRNNATNDSADDSTGRGFTFTVPAGPEGRVLKVYTSVFKADGTLTASLADDGASFTDTVTSAITGVQTEAIWEITFSSAVADTLEVEWKVTAERDNGHYSNINLNAATLVPEPGTLVLLLAGGAAAMLRRRDRA